MDFDEASLSKRVPEIASHPFEPAPKMIPYIDRPIKESVHSQPDNSPGPDGTGALEGMITGHKLFASVHDQTAYSPDEQASSTERSGHFIGLLMSYFLEVAAMPAVSVDLTTNPASDPPQAGYNPRLISSLFTNPFDRVPILLSWVYFLFRQLTPSQPIWDLPKQRTYRRRPLAHTGSNPSCDKDNRFPK